MRGCRSRVLVFAGLALAAQSSLLSCSRSPIGFSAARSTTGDRGSGQPDAGQAVDVDGGLGCSLSAPADDWPTRLTWLQGTIASDIQAFEKAHGGAGALACPGPGEHAGEALNDFTTYALAKMALATPSDTASAADAEAMVRCAFSFQTYQSDAGAEQGVFPFHIGDSPNISDNGNEFALEYLGPLLLDYGSRFSGSFGPYLAPRIQAAADALMNGHDVCPSYTNICLMQGFELMALGRWFAQSGDAPSAAYAQTLLQASAARMAAWTAFTQQNGIFEFDTSTYYNVDVQMLGLGARYAVDDVTRKPFAAALGYFWADIAANTFFGRGSLAGPHSRSYDLLSARGSLETPMYLAGLRNARPSGGIAETPHLLAFTAPTWPVPTASLCAAADATREVRSTWVKKSTDVGHERYAYITPDYALGSTSADYGSDSNDQDMLLTAELPSNPSSAIVSVLPDYLDAPGTSEREGDFTKVTHLPLGAAAAQKGGAMLSLLRVPAKNPGYSGNAGEAVALVNLSTNIILPADADELLLDGLPASTTTDTLATALPTVTVRFGTGAVAVSVVAAHGLECPDSTGKMVETAPAEIHLEPYQPATGTSRPPPVMRLAIYHATTLPQDTSSCFARVALLWVADHCAGTGCAAALSAAAAKAAAAATSIWDSQTQAWSVGVATTTPEGPGPSLLVARTVSPLSLTRKVDGQDMTFAPLSVNGMGIALGP